jgi:hypothetical protein
MTCREIHVVLVWNCIYCIYIYIYIYIWRRRRIKWFLGGGNANICVCTMRNGRCIYHDYTLDVPQQRSQGRALSKQRGGTCSCLVGVKWCNSTYGVDTRRCVVIWDYMLKRIVPTILHDIYCCFCRHSRIPDDVCILKLLYMLKFALRSKCFKERYSTSIHDSAQTIEICLDGAVLGNDSTRFVIDDTL